MNEKATVVWLRQDLRLIDHPALHAAAERGTVWPLYIWDPEEKGEWALGAASKCWLHGSLSALQQQFSELDIPLTIRRGPVHQVLDSFLKETKADALFWSRRYEPAATALDRETEALFLQAGYRVQSYNSHLLYEPEEIQNKQGKPYQVFTPFWKACLNQPFSHEPLSSLKAPSKSLFKPQTLAVEDLHLLPKIHWDTEIRTTWVPGTEGGLALLKRFLQGPILDYHHNRDFPALEGGSRMSPYLSFGEISPRMIWQAVREHYTQKAEKTACDLYLRQLIWREFAYHLLYHFPKTPNYALRADFAHFPWTTNPEYLKAWQQGQTGYPLVDAGMRQLWRTGWMHNRVRMVVGSFLVKDLLIAWQEGARWFWDTLVDADLANNTLGWQWVGGCGADAAPYFRIFHPVTQSEKFDRGGEYIRRFVPELAELPEKWIHAPWRAPESVLQAAGVELGVNYPKPIVDHAQARDAALKAFYSLKAQKGKERVGEEY